MCQSLKRAIPSRKYSIDAPAKCNTCLCLDGDLHSMTYTIGPLDSKDYNDDEHCTPMEVAAENGQCEVVKFLLESNADSFLSIQGVPFGYKRPLRSAAYKGQLDMVRLLVSHPTCKTFMVKNDYLEILMLSQTKMLMKSFA